MTLCPFIYGRETTFFSYQLKSNFSKNPAKKSLLRAAGKLNLNFITKNSNLIFPPVHLKFFWRVSKKNSLLRAQFILNGLKALSWNLVLLLRQAYEFYRWIWFDQMSKIGFDREKERKIVIYKKNGYFGFYFISADRWLLQ